MQQQPGCDPNQAQKKSNKQYNLMATSMKGAPQIYSAYIDILPASVRIEAYFVYFGLNCQHLLYLTETEQSIAETKQSTRETTSPMLYSIPYDKTAMRVLLFA